MIKKIRILAIVCLVGVCGQAWAADTAMLHQLLTQQAQANAQTRAEIQALQPTLTQGLGGTDSAGAYDPTYASPGAINPAQTSCQSQGYYWDSSSQTCSMNVASACANLGGSYSGNKCQMPSIGSGSGGNPSAGYSIAGDGTMTEWGQVAVHGRNYVTVTFPHAFPHSAASVIGTLHASTWKYEVQTYSWNNNSATFYIPDTSTPSFSWQATGW